MTPKKPPEIRKKGSRGEPEPVPEDDRIKRLRWILNQNVPVIGNWMQRKVLSALAESALQGNPHAVTAMAQALARDEHDEDDKALAAQTLARVNFTNGIDAAWAVWAETRSKPLETILVEKQRPATHPASARVLSALCLNDLDTITRGSADLVNALINACDDPDPVIAGRANTAIRGLKNQSSIDMLCRAWVERRTALLAQVMKEAGYTAHKPPTVRVLAALKIDQPRVLMQASADMVSPLVAAVEDGDPDVSSRARTYLLHLNQQGAVDAFCALWSLTRLPVLEEALLKAGYKARSPIEVRVLVSLKSGSVDAARDIPPDGLSALLDATGDQDETIRENARLALESLTQEDTRNALAMQVIQTGSPLAREIALQRGYLPTAPENRALFYFLTEQWQSYDELDYDQSMMRTLYEAAPPEQRARIAARVQSAGRTAYLTILAGVDYRSRAQVVNPEEAGLLVRVLAENKEWNRLWRVASDLALPFGLEIIHALKRAGWQPGEELDRQLFAELAALADQHMLLGGQELARALPLALPCASLKVSGRINEVAFSPVEPLLAIASSHRKLVVWNFAEAKIAQQYSGFKHSVGKVMYTPRGTLICGERTNAGSLCTLYVYEDGESYQLCNHNGSITVLEMAGPGRLLTAGRDQKLVLWDLFNRRLIKEVTLNDTWARNAAVSPDEETFAFLGSKLELFRLPEMRAIPGQPFIAPRVTGKNGYRKGIAHYAAFSPDGKFILTGQHNGQVALYFHNSVFQAPRRGVITEHSQPVRGIHFLPGHPLVVTAGGEGLVRFIRWPEMTPAGAVHSPEGRLTSLHISRNGDFMATGTSEASLRLWDLRVLDIPDLFAQPLATASHEQITKVMALSEYGGLPEPVRNGLKFMRLLLQYRFRFDIEIEEAPIIQSGEFDILIDDE